MARDPSYSIPDVQPTGPSGGVVSERASPQDFGSPLGSALTGLGGQLEQTGQAASAYAVQLQNIKNETETRDAVTSANKDLADLEYNYRTNKRGLNAADSYKEAQSGIDQIRQTHRESLSNPMAQKAFDSEFARAAGNSIRQVGTWAADQTHAANLTSLKSSMETDAQLMAAHYNDPDALHQHMDDLVGHAAHWAATQGFDKAAADATISHYAGYGAQGMVTQALAAGGPKAARQIFDQLAAQKIPGTDLPVLNAEHSGVISQMIDQKQMAADQRALTQTLRAEAAQRKAESEANEFASNKIVNQLIKDPTQFDPSQITDNASLKPGAREGLFHMYQARLKDIAKGTHDENTYGPGITDFYNRVHAPADDPQRITDPSDLYKYVKTGDLTISGVDKLTQEITGKRSLDGQNFALQQNQFLKAARAKLVHDDFDMKDPQGEDRYTKFLTLALPAIEKGRADGLSASALFNEDSKDSLYGLINSVKRPPAQAVKDVVNAGARPRYDMNTRDGIIASFQAIQAPTEADREKYRQLLAAKGFAKVGPPKLAPPIAGSE